MGRSRKVRTAAFNAKVALAAVKDLETVSEVASRHKIHPTQVYQLKKQSLENAELVFSNGTGRNVLSWRFSNRLEGRFCLEVLEGGVNETPAHDFQYGSGSTVNQPGVYEPVVCDRGHQHGWERPCVGHRVHPSLVVEREVRAFVPERLHECSIADWGHTWITSIGNVHIRVWSTTHRRLCTPASRACQA